MPLKSQNAPTAFRPTAPAAFTLIALVGAFLLVKVLDAAEIPELVLPAGVGVNIHFTRGHERDLDMIASAGFKFIRMDFSWGGTEQKQGSYDWSEYDELTANLDRRGIRAYYILDYSNPLYEETAVSKNPISGHEEKALISPQHAASIEAFARWAVAAAEHFHGRHVVWEIWNEPNIFFWQPKPEVNQYTALALATAKAVRTADPQATIFAPTTSEFPWPFLEHVLQSGVLEYLDGVSVHPYRSPDRSPETAAKDFERLRGIIATNLPPRQKKSIPIISGEWGYSSNTKGVSLENQAAFIARQQLSNLLDGVPISIWYDWKNDGDDPSENEHNFGTVKSDLQPKPAYTAVKTLTRELGGFRIARRFPTASTDDFVLVLTNSSSQTKLAAWTLNKVHPIAVPIKLSTANGIRVVDGQGQESQAAFENNQLTLQLTSAPQYVNLGRAQPLP